MLRGDIQDLLGVCGVAHSCSISFVGLREPTLKAAAEPVAVVFEICPPVPGEGEVLALSNGIKLNLDPLSPPLCTVTGGGKLALISAGDRVLDDADVTIVTTVDVDDVGVCSVAVVVVTINAGAATI